MNIARSRLQKRKKLRNLRIKLKKHEKHLYNGKQKKRGGFAGDFAMLRRVQIPPPALTECP
jgi:hypothetical protein